VKLGFETLIAANRAIHNYAPNRVKLPRNHVGETDRAVLQVALAACRDGAHVATGKAGEQYAAAAEAIQLVIQMIDAEVD